MTEKKEKKKTKTDKIVQLLLEAENPAHMGFTNKELADHLECSTSHVWKVRKAVEERLRPDEQLAGVDDNSFWAGIGTADATYELDKAEKIKQHSQATSDFAYNLTKGGKPPEEGTYTRSSVLDTAKQYVTKDREATHGDMENNFEAIAMLWEQYFNCEWSFSPTDVAMMMALLKIARLKSNKDNPDNYIDACGYMACAGELALKKVTKK